jgi:hypothetical protein
VCDYVCVCMSEGVAVGGVCVRVRGTNTCAAWLCERARELTCVHVSASVRVGMAVSVGGVYVRMCMRVGERVRIYVRALTCTRACKCV